MPCVVYLYYPDEIVIVKSAWCEKMNTADILNTGSRPGEVMLIFHSPDKTAKADFELEPRNIYNDAITACYYGYVLQICGK